MALFIYTLQLEQNKYYIGKTKNPFIRLDDHFNGMGTNWTNKYKPIKILEIISNCDDYDEDKMTLIYMDKYGVDNVRGGSFTTMELTSATKQFISQMLKSANNQCFKCGDKGHLAAECMSDKIIEKCDCWFSCWRHEKNKCIFKRSKCSRCGRNNHDRSKCYAGRHVNGYYI